MNRTNSKFPLPVFAWLALLALSFLGLILGELVGHARWMPLLVAAIIWAKGSMVARYFIESHKAHPYIAWVIRIFVAFVPVALVITAFLENKPEVHNDGSQNDMCSSWHLLDQP